MLKYQIAVDTPVLKDILDKTTQSKNVSHPANGYLKAFEEKISTHENDSIQLTNNMARIYKTNRKKNVRYCTLNVTCQGCPCKYTITLDDEPDFSQPAIFFNVQRNSEHQNHVKTQIRGAENRDEVAKDIIVQCNGSAMAYALKKESREEEAASEDVSFSDYSNFKLIVKYVFFTGLPKNSSRISPKSS